jgi:hypothetical protein
VRTCAFSIRFTPVVDETSRGYRFVGDAVIEGLLSGVVSVPWRMASPPGFEDAWMVKVLGNTRVA